MIPSKICKKCGVMQYILEFRLQKGGNYAITCNDCIYLKQKQYNKNNKENIKLNKKQHYQNNKEYFFLKRKKYNQNNRKNIALKQKEYYANNKENLATKKKEYYLRNREKTILMVKKYYENNKEKINISKNKNSNQKYANDPTYRLRIIASKSINIYLKSKNTNKKGKSVLKHLPYTIEELKSHIENQFESWMNWNNQGVYDPKKWDDNDPSTWKWQLDHIIPHSTFEYDSMDHLDFQKCWALSNLRPYSAKQNLLDGATKIRHHKIYANKNKKE